MIGVFDSGVGGLSVLKEIDKQLPQHSYSYLADSAFAPYGDKSSDEIIRRCEFLVESLISIGAEIVVVACNTATALAVDHLRKKYAVPIVAMEPAVKPAVEMSHRDAVGILATTRTLSSQRYALLLENFAQGAQVYEQACSGLVEKVESLEIDSEETQQLLKKYLEPLLNRQIDTLVLGCTHYPFLKENISAICGQQVNIVDTAEAVTLQIKRKLSEISLNKSLPATQKRFYTTGDQQQFQQQLNFYWNTKAKAEKI